MREAINFLITLSLFVLAVQFYVVDSKPVVAQIDDNASEDLDVENGQIERKAEYLKTDDGIREDYRTGRIGTPEEKQPEGVRIEEFRLRDVGENNLPAEPPENAIEFEL